MGGKDTDTVTWARSDQKLEAHPAVAMTIHDDQLGTGSSSDARDRHRWMYLGGYERKEGYSTVQSHPNGPLNGRTRGVLRLFQHQAVLAGLPRLGLVPAAAGAAALRPFPAAALLAVANGDCKCKASAASSRPGTPLPPPPPHPTPPHPHSARSADASRRGTLNPKR